MGDEVWCREREVSRISRRAVQSLRVISVSLLNCEHHDLNQNPQNIRGDIVIKFSLHQTSSLSPLERWCLVTSRAQPRIPSLSTITITYPRPHESRTKSRHPNPSIELQRTPSTPTTTHKMASFIPSSILTLVGVQQPHFLDLSTDALPKTINQQPSASFSSTSILFSLASSSVRQEETRPLLPHRGLSSHIISRSAVGLDLTRSLSPSPSPPYPHSRTPSSSASALVTTQPEGIRILGQPSTCPVTLASTWFYSPPVYSSTGYCPYRYREIMVLLERMYFYPDGNRFKTPVCVKDGTVVHVVQREFSREFDFLLFLPCLSLFHVLSPLDLWTLGKSY